MTTSWLLLMLVNPASGSSAIDKAVVASETFPWRESKPLNQFTSHPFCFWEISSSFFRRLSKALLKVRTVEDASMKKRTILNSIRRTAVSSAPVLRMLSLALPQMRSIRRLRELVVAR